MDWSLRHCSWHGHETYAPDEPALRARLQVDTTVGSAWRCLRCGTFVLESPRRSGPADQAPEVPRGQLLRDRWLMRLLAIDRAVRVFLGLLIAYAVFDFRGSKERFNAMFGDEIPLLRPIAHQIGWNIDDSKIVQGIHAAFGLSDTMLLWLGIGCIVYAAMNLIEAVGLWLMKRWGEYFAVIATGLFLPLEVYELIEHVTALRIGALLINIAAVCWLVWSKRLFGLRGGAAAHHTEHSEESLLTVERAAATA